MNTKCPEITAEHGPEAPMNATYHNISNGERFTFITMLLNIGDSVCIVLTVHYYEYK